MSFTRAAQPTNSQAAPPDADPGRKADRLLDELGWTLATPPAVPRGVHWHLIGAHYDGDPQWAAYLREPSAA